MRVPAKRGPGVTLAGTPPRATAAAVLQVVISHWAVRQLRLCFFGEPAIGISQALPQVQYAQWKR